MNTSLERNLRERERERETEREREREREQRQRQPDAVGEETSAKPLFVLLRHSCMLGSRRRL